MEDSALQHNYSNPVNDLSYQGTYTSSSGKKPIDPIKELTIQMSSLTNQIKQLKENAKGFGQNLPKQKCHFCGERTHAAVDCNSKSKSTTLKVDEVADKSEASSSSKVKKSSVAKTSSKGLTNVWVPKKD